MRNSTLYRDSILSDYLICGEQKYQITISSNHGRNENFSGQIIIFRDGNFSNFNDENVIRREWFEQNYSYEDFLEDYGLIHRLQSSCSELFNFLMDGFKSETQKRQQLEKLQAQFDDLTTKYTQATLLLAQHGIPVNKKRAPKSARSKRLTTRK